jgi:hypothetical protein
MLKKYSISTLDSTGVKKGPVQSKSEQQNKISALIRRGKTVDKLGLVELRAVLNAVPTSTG